MANPAVTPWDERRFTREAVAFRLEGFGPDAQRLVFDVVNLSPEGLMAHSPAILAPGDRLRLRMPVLGVTPAEVRWFEAHRLGCRFDTAVDRATFYELLATVLRLSGA